jgi:hypothetical protein
MRNKTVDDQNPYQSPLVAIERQRPTKRPDFIDRIPTPIKVLLVVAFVAFWVYMLVPAYRDAKEREQFRRSHKIDETGHIVPINENRND